MNRAVIIAIVIVVLILIIGLWMYSATPSAPQASPQPMAAPPMGASSVAAPASAPSGAPQGYPGGFAEGDVLRCPTDGGIYRLMSGSKRHYPSMAVYTRLGSPAFRNVDCGALAQIPTGPDMA